MRIRSLLVKKEIIGNKSGEFILNQIYQTQKNNIYSKKQTNKENGTSIVIEDIDDLDEEMKDGLAHIMTNEEEINIRNALGKNFLFKDITPEVLDLILNELIYFQFPKI